MREPIYLWPETNHNQPPRLYTVGQDEQQRADADQQSQPDDHYFQAAGEEPPPARKRRWWNNWETNVMLAALAGILVILAVCPVW